MLELKIGQRKQSRPVKQWIDVIEEDNEKKGSYATGCRG